MHTVILSAFFGLDGFSCDENTGYCFCIRNVSLLMFSSVVEFINNGGPAVRHYPVYTTTLTNLFCATITFYGCFPSAATLHYASTNSTTATLRNFARFLR